MYRISNRTGNANSSRPDRRQDQWFVYDSQTLPTIGGWDRFANIIISFQRLSNELDAATGDEMLAANAVVASRVHDTYRLGNQSLDGRTLTIIITSENHNGSLPMPTYQPGNQGSIVSWPMFIETMEHLEQTFHPGRQWPWNRAPNPGAQPVPAQATLNPPNLIFVSRSISSFGVAANAFTDFATRFVNWVPGIRLVWQVPDSWPAAPTRPANHFFPANQTANLTNALNAARDPVFRMKYLQGLLSDLLTHQGLMGELQATWLQEELQMRTSAMAPERAGSIQVRGKGRLHF